MLIVAVDTTATFVDVMLKSTNWMQLLTLAHGSQVKVVVPEVVLLETARHWESRAAGAIERANGKINGLQKSRDELTDLGIDSSSIVDSQPVSATPSKESFTYDMREKLAALAVDIRPIPSSIDITDVLERDLDRRKPFQANGKGFRDALVWETVAEVAREAESSDEVFFVSDNSSDYCDASGDLDAELRTELEGAADKFYLVKTLHELVALPQIAAKVDGLAQSEEQLAQFIADATDAGDPNAEPVLVDDVVRDAVLRAIDRLAGEEVATHNEGTSGIAFYETGIPAWIDNLTIESIDPEETTLTWQTYETYQDTTLLIKAEIIGWVTLDGLASKGDVSARADEEQVDIVEWDWNDHVAHVSTSVEVRMTFQIRVERGMDAADECEFEGAERV